MRVSKRPPGAVPRMQTCRSDPLWPGRKFRGVTQDSNLLCLSFTRRIVTFREGSPDVRGRPPQDPQTKRLRGVPPGRIPTPPPVPPVDGLTRPRSLTPAARKLWDHLAPSLIERHVLDMWRGPAFAILCESLATHARATTALDRCADLVSPEARVLFRTQRDAATVARQFLESFGLTAASAGRVVSEKPTEDELEALLTDLKRPRGRYDPPPPGALRTVPIHPDSARRGRKAPDGNAS
jgi:Phage terminase, small subunit